MPPAEESSTEKCGDDVGNGGVRPISTVLIIIAMQTEALPLVERFRLTENTDAPFPTGVAWCIQRPKYQFSVAREGPHFGVGTISASLVVYASIQALKPDLIINAGTAGGFKAKGACVGDVYLASDIAFHDRRIPIPVVVPYGIGARQTFSTPSLLNELKLKVGKLSIGNSLDMSPHDEALILANEATLKDMEGAAVADLFSMPAIFIKAVTHIVDGEKPTSEFLQNLVAVGAALDQAVTQAIDFICGKVLDQL